MTWPAKGVSPQRLHGRCPNKNSIIRVRWVAVLITEVFEGEDRSRALIGGQGSEFGLLVKSANLRTFDRAVKTFIDKSTFFNEHRSKWVSAAVPVRN